MASFILFILFTSIHLAVIYRAAIHILDLQEQVDELEASMWRLYEDLKKRA